MAKDVLWAVLLINLLALSSVLGYAAMRPAHVLAYGFSFDQALEMVRTGDVFNFEFEIGEDGEVLVADAPPARSESRPAARGSSTPPPRATSGDAPPSREEMANRPPPRREAEDERRAVAQAIHRGDMRQTITAVQPPVEMYPFTIERRTYPEPGVMQVDILVENRSGRLWQTARIIMRGEDRSYPPQVFEVQNWRLDGRARLSYRFPEDQVEGRIRMLRIIGVDGESVTSPLLQGRGLPAQTARTEGAEDTRVFQVEPVEIGSAVTLAPDFDFSLQGLPPVPREINVSGLPEASQSIGESARELHRLGLRIEQLLDDAVLRINADGFEDARASDGFASTVGQLLDAREEYDEKAIDLMVTASRHRNQAVARVLEQVDEMSTVLFMKLEDFNRQAISQDPEFNLGAAAGR